MSKKFKVIRITGVVMGVGFEEKIKGGVYSEHICETFYDSGNGKKDAADSEKWATAICNALNMVYEDESKIETGNGLKK